MNVYPFIEAERVERSNARRACAMLEVSRAAYYGWARQIPSARQSSDEALLAKIKDIHTASRGTYGSPRVHAQLSRAARKQATRRSKNVPPWHSCPAKMSRVENRVMGSMTAAVGSGVWRGARSELGVGRAAGREQCRGLPALA